MKNITLSLDQDKFIDLVLSSNGSILEYLDSETASSIVDSDIPELIYKRDIRFADKLSLATCFKYGIYLTDCHLENGFFNKTKEFVNYFNQIKSDSFKNTVLKTISYYVLNRYHYSHMITFDLSADQRSFIENNNIKFTVPSYLKYKVFVSMQKSLLKIKFDQSSKLILDDVQDLKDALMNHFVKFDYFICHKKNMMKNKEVISVFHDLIIQKPEIAKRETVLMSDLISVCGLPIPEKIDLSFINKVKSCSYEPYRISLFEKAREQLSVDECLEILLITKVEKPVFINSLFNETHSKIILDQFNVSKLLKLPRKTLFDNIKKEIMDGFDPLKDITLT